MFPIKDFFRSGARLSAAAKMLMSCALVRAEPGGCYVSGVLRGKPGQADHGHTALDFENGVAGSSFRPGRGDGSGAEGGGDCDCDGDGDGGSDGNAVRRRGCRLVNMSFAGRRSKLLTGIVSVEDCTGR